MGKNYRLAVAFTSYALAGTALALPVVAQDAAFSLTAVPLVLEGTALAIDVTTFDADLVGPPAWLPSAGTVADLGTETLDAAAGRTTNFWRSYSGIGWAPWWGTYGSVIAAGGGHGDGEYNDIYRFDLATQDWSRIKTAATSYKKPATGYNADTATGWMWANATNGDTTLQTGELHADHHYSNLLCLPSDAISGTAPNGWVVKAGTVSIPETGSAGTARLCKLAMGQDETWSHTGTGDTATSSHGGSAYDSLRARVWFRPDAMGRTLYYKDLSGGAEGSLFFSGSSWETAEGNLLEYDAVEDVLIRYANGGDSSGVTLRVLDPADGTQYTPTISGSGVSAGWWAGCWSSEWRCLVIYPGQNNTVYFLKPSGDPRTTTWTWSSQTFTGTARPLYIDGNGGGQGYNRLRHVSSLGNVLIWCAQSSQPVQLVHLSSAP